MQNQTSSQKEKKIHPALPYYAAAACFALLSLLMRMDRMSQLLIALAVSLLVFIILRAMFPAHSKTEKATSYGKTGNTEADELLKEGRKAIVSINTARAKISDRAFAEQLTKLSSLCSQILQKVSEQPECAKKLRRFMDYYLPTTLKLIECYEQLQNKQDAGSANISKTIATIENSSALIVQAFQKQLDNLYADQALDITTDVQVLENMMSRDGLSTSLGSITDALSK